MTTTHPNPRLSPSGPPRAFLLATSGYTSRGTGALFKTLYQRDQDFVHVTSFMTPEEQADVFNGTLLYDHEPAIRAAINYALYGDGAPNPPGGPRVRLPAGILRIDSPIQVGYGTDFRGLLIEGEGIRYGGTQGSTSAGTAIVATFNDAPGIAVQGARYTHLKDFSIYGQNEEHIATIMADPEMSNLDIDNWIDPSFPASASSRYAPYAGIAIDPYGGPQPVVHYPDVNYPEFLGATTQYDKELSTGVVLENILIQGFFVGVVQQPCDDDGNGDFTKLLNCKIYFCAYGVAWGNSQSRLLRIQDTDFNVVHTGLATTVFGKQQGRPDVACFGCSFNTMIQILDIPNLGFGQGPAFYHGFGELLYSIGIVGQAADVAGSVLFDDVELGFGLWGQYGVPTYVLDSQGSSLTTFRNVLFFLAGFANPVIDVTDAWGGLGFEAFGTGGSTDGASNYAFEGCTFQYSEEPTQLWQKCALNATQGMSFRNLSCGVQCFRGIRVGHRYNLNTGADEGVALYGENNFGDRTLCLPVYAPWAKGLKFGPDPGVPNLWRDNAIVAAGATVATGRNIVFNDAGYGLGHLMQSGGLVGDVIQSQTTRAVFWIYSRTGAQISARAQTGFDQNGNLLEAIPSNEEFSTLNTRRYSPGPNAVLYGDITNASPDITNIVLGTQGDPTIANLVSVGDIIFTSDEYDRIIDIFSGAAVIQSIDEGANEITFGGNFTRTETHMRLGVFARTPVANGTPT